MILMDYNSWMSSFLWVANSNHNKPYPGLFEVIGNWKSASSSLVVGNRFFS